MKTEGGRMQRKKQTKEQQVVKISKRMPRIIKRKTTLDNTTWEGLSEEATFK